MKEHTNNRMQEHWGKMSAFIKREWPLMTEVDIEDIDGEYDRLITKIKELYKGNVEIIQEAAIKAKIQRFLNEAESKTENAA